MRRSVRCSSHFATNCPQIFSMYPAVPPQSDGSGQDRVLLKKASDLLAAAGCTRADGVLKLPDGKPLEMEFLDFSSAP